jgi:hypothetical protein
MHCTQPSSVNPPGMLCTAHYPVLSTPLECCALHATLLCSVYPMECCALHTAQFCLPPWSAVHCTQPRSVYPPGVLCTSHYPVLSTPLECCALHTAQFCLPPWSAVYPPGVLSTTQFSLPLWSAVQCMLMAACALCFFCMSSIWTTWNLPESTMRERSRLLIGKYIDQICCFFLK